MAPPAQSGVGDWNPTGMPDNAPLRVAGQSADGGLIWNTGAVSYPVGSPDIETRVLTNVGNTTTQPVYDPLTGMPTGYASAADSADMPAMRYGEQMRNVGAFVGTLGRNFGIGIAQGTIGLVSDAAKGWAMIGDLAVTGGSNISQLEQFNLRPFQYDAGAGQFAGAVGEMFSPGAYAEAAKLGVLGLRALGPTADAAIYNYLQRSGGVLSAVPESGTASSIELTSIPVNGATRTVSLGFRSEVQQARAIQELHGVLSASGITDAVIGIRGSSVTGFSYRSGTPFTATSDIDAFIESAQLTEGLSTSKNIPGFVHPSLILRNYPLLEQWTTDWTKILGRDITPGAFTPGNIPNHPAILFK